MEIEGQKTMNLKGNLAYSYQVARSMHFTMQQISLPFFESVTSGKNKFRTIEYPEFIKKLLQELLQLLKEDSENIATGLYPLEVLRPEDPRNHFLRYPKILFDGFFLSRRREGLKSKEFTSQAQEFLNEMPEYFRRNFHFQTDGYLSEHSAELYEHQVEILFSGAADAMRRLVIPLLRKEIQNLSGEGLNFLEVGAGTGRLTKFMSLSYPKAKIVASDLSPPYLKKAQENLQNFPRIDFVQAAAENLPFKAQSFDLAYSCFLFHELPQEVRRKVIQEAHRVLKPEALFAFVDSAQKHDIVAKAELLEHFPKEFHEPFYKNYTLHPMEDLLKEEGFEILQSRARLFSKAVLARKKA